MRYFAASSVVKVLIGRRHGLQRLSDVTEIWLPVCQKTLPMVKKEWRTENMERRKAAPMNKKERTRKMRVKTIGRKLVEELRVEGIIMAERRMRRVEIMERSKPIREMQSKMEEVNKTIERIGPMLRVVNILIIHSNQALPCQHKFLWKTKSCQSLRKQNQTRVPTLHLVLF